MKALLVFPPVWLPDAPYLSTPILKAYLGERGIEATQIDLNVRFWDHFYEDDVVETVYDRIATQFLRLSDDDISTQADLDLLMKLAAVRRLPKQRFRYEVQNKIISQDFYRILARSLCGFNEDGKIPNLRRSSSVESIQDYHDLLFSDISFSKYADSTESLLTAVGKGSSNPYREFYRRFALSDIVKISPDVIGITIAAVNQVVPAFAFAAEAKEICPTAHIVVGGPWCTIVEEQLAKSLEEFSFIDSVGILEGEEVLFQLCATLQRGDDLGSVPNLIFKRNGKAVRNRMGDSVMVNDLPTPDFDDLPLDKYDSPACLPIQGARGCYWAKCKFCSYHMMEPGYRVQKADVLVDHIKELQTRYHAVTFSLADAAVSPGFARRFSECLLQAKLSIRWIGFARFDKEFSRELLDLMARSGCVQISWGLESACSRVLNVIGKHIDIEIAAGILNQANASGIHNRLLVMYGLPTEELADAILTVEFVRQNLSNLGSLSFNYYSPEKRSPVETFQTEYGLKVTYDKMKDLSCACEIERSMSIGDACLIRDSFRDLEETICRDPRRSGQVSVRFGDPYTTSETFTVSVGGERTEYKLISALCESNGMLARNLFLVYDH